jgi:hypothetical protein
MLNFFIFISLGEMPVVSLIKRKTSAKDQLQLGRYCNLDFLFTPVFLLPFCGGLYL